MSGVARNSPLAQTTAHIPSAALMASVLSLLPKCCSYTTSADRYSRRASLSNPVICFSVANAYDASPDASDEPQHRDRSADDRSCVRDRSQRTYQQRYGFVRDSVFVHSKWI